MRIHGLMPLVSYSGCCRELAKALADARASVGGRISEALAGACASGAGLKPQRLRRVRFTGPQPCEIRVLAWLA